MKPIQIISRILIVCLIVLLYSSCSDKYYCNKAAKLQSKHCTIKSNITNTLDTTIIRYNYRDTTIYRERDSFGIRVNSPCDSTGRVKNFVKETKGRHGSAKMIGDSATNTITAIAICNELNIKLKIQEKITDFYRTKIIENSYSSPPSQWDKIKQKFNEFLYLLVPILIIAILIKRR